MAEDFDSDFEETGGAAGPFDVRSLLLYGVARSRLIVVGLTLLGVIGGLAYSLTLPNQYTSVGKILLTLGARENLTPEASVDEDFDARKQRIGVREEMELLQNPEVDRRVAERIGPERLLAAYDPRRNDGPNTPWIYRRLHDLQAWWFGSDDPTRSTNFDPTSPLATEGAAMVAASTTNIFNASRTNILIFWTDAHDPQLAQDIATAYMEVSQEWHQETYAAEKNLPFITDRLGDAMEEVKLTSDRYKDHRQDCGFIDLQAQRSTLLTQVAELELENERAKIRLDEIKKELAKAEEQLSGADAMVERILPPERVQNPRYTSLIKQLENLNNDLTNLGSTYKEGSPSFLSQEANLKERIKRVEAELGKTDYYKEFGEARPGIVENPLIEELTVKMAELEREREGLAIAVETRKETLRNRHEALDAVLACDATHRLLELEVSSAEQKVHELSSALDRAEQLGAIDRDEQMSNLAVIQTPTYPLTKSGPDRWRYVFLGLVGGIFAGVGLAVLRQMLDSRVRYPDTLEAQLGVRLLSVVPEERRWKSRGGKLKKKALAGSAR